MIKQTDERERLAGSVPSHSLYISAELGRRVWENTVSMCHTRGVFLMIFPPSMQTPGTALGVAKKN